MSDKITYSQCVDCKKTTYLKNGRCTICNKRADAKLAQEMLLEKQTEVYKIQAQLIDIDKYKNIFELLRLIDE